MKWVTGIMVAIAIAFVGIAGYFLYLGLSLERRTTASHPAQLATESTHSPVGPKIRQAIIDLANGLEQNPGLQGYVLSRGIVKEDDEVMVIQNKASSTIYQNMQSPDVIRDAVEGAKHTKPSETFSLKLSRVAPGFLIDLTRDGRQGFSESLISDGIREGYQDTTVYLITKNVDLNGRDTIIAYSKQVGPTISDPSATSATSADITSNQTFTSEDGGYTIGFDPASEYSWASIKLSALFKDDFAGLPGGGVDAFEYSTPVLGHMFVTWHTIDPQTPLTSELTSADSAFLDWFKKPYQNTRFDVLPSLAPQRVIVSGETGLMLATLLRIGNPDWNSIRLARFNLTVVHHLDRSYYFALIYTYDENPQTDEERSRYADGNGKQRYSDFAKSTEEMYTKFLSSLKFR